MGKNRKDSKKEGRAETAGKDSDKHTHAHTLAHRAEWKHKQRVKGKRLSSPGKRSLRSEDVRERYDEVGRKGD